jgi:2-methylcitrate dehydratase PrpD
MTYSQQLGQIISGLRYEDIPAPVIQKLKTCLLYGTTMSVTAADDRALLEAVVQMHSAPGQAKTIVLPLQLRAADAAYVDAYRMCSRGQNDTFADIVAHPGCIVIPAVLAVAQECQASGREVLTALAAGYECLASIAAGAAASVVKNRFRATSVSHI